MGRWRGWALRHRPLVVVLAVGLVVRAALLPFWHGQDFVVWTLASSATLRGVNVYAHHPPYPGGPYAYFPLFLDVELPFRWLAEHAGMSFTVLGKLPIVAADVAVALFIHRELSRAGASARAAAVGAAAFFLNPLVLYNGAWYGRFDALALALLLAAGTRLTSDRRVTLSGAIAYALAVAAKTFPLFLLPLFIRRARRGRWQLVVATVAVLGVLSLPYLGDPVPYFKDIFYDLGKTPQGMSWWFAVRLTAGNTVAQYVSDIGLVVFAVGALVIARRARRGPFDLGIAATLVLFLLCNKVVLEQYLIWPLPWLIIAAGRRDRRALASVLLGAGLTLAGCLDNESFHPFGHESAPIGVLLALAELAFLVVVLRRGPAPRSAERVLETDASDHRPQPSAGLRTGPAEVVPGQPTG